MKYPKLGKDPSSWTKLNLLLVIWSLGLSDQAWARLLGLISPLGQAWLTITFAISQNLTQICHFIHCSCAEFLLKINLQFCLGKNRSKIELEDHAKISVYWPVPWSLILFIFLAVKTEVWSQTRALHACMGPRQLM